MRGSSDEANSFPSCRLEKDDSNGGSSNKIEGTLVAHEARGRFCRNFDWSVVAHEWSDVLDSGGVKQIV